MISPPTTAPPGESKPPSTTAGIAASATRPTPPVTPAAGKRRQEQPADRRQRARQRPRRRGHAVEADAHQRGGLAVLGRGAHRDAPVGVLEGGGEAGHEQQRDAARDHARRRDADAGDLDDVACPRARRRSARRCRSGA